MSMQDYIRCSDDGWKLIGSIWAVPNPKATVVIAHGINEHIGRYGHVAKALNLAGYSVVGVDHRGHGRSDNGKPRTSYIKRFDTFVDDYIEIIRQVKREAAGPVIALGHSMGGLIAVRASLQIQSELSALVLTGPALRIPSDLNGFRLSVSLFVARFVPFLNAPVGAIDGLSRDPSVYERFVADDLCINEPVKLGIARQLVLLSEATRARANEINLPLLVMHGGADKITMPEGSIEFVANAISPDKEFVAWPGDQHEIFNELDREAVLTKLTRWLNDRFPQSESN